MYFQHEDLSLKMFDYLVEDNKLSPEFEKYKLTETDKTFIKELIKGRENDQNGVKKSWFILQNFKKLLESNLFFIKSPTHQTKIVIITKMKYSRKTWLLSRVSKLMKHYAIMTVVVIFLSLQLIFQDNFFNIKLCDS